MDIDILTLIERLEKLQEDAKPQLLRPGRICVDEQEFTGIVEQLRFVLPDEIKNAKRILQQRDKILSDAQAEADRIRAEAQREAEKLLAQAREHARYLIERDGLLDEAKREAERIIGEARQEAERIREGADDYSRQVLLDLEDVVTRQLNVIRKGIEVLGQRR
jgi:cell division septum initiation protein DivIVA